MEDLNYSLRLRQLQKQYDSLRNNNDGDGLISVYADRAGIVKNVDTHINPQILYEAGTYVLSVVDKGVNETLVQMRKLKSSQFESDEPDETGYRSADLGKKLRVTIDGDSFGGRAIGVNGNKKPYYLAEEGDGYVFTTCTPGNEYFDQFYAEFDKEIDYEKVLVEKNKVNIVFDSRRYEDLPILDKGVIYTEYNENKTVEYVWKLVDGELTKQYILTMGIPDYDGAERIVIDGVEIGDKVIREIISDTEE
jgi:hypothetical protein